MKQFFFFGWVCLLMFSCTVAQKGYQLKSDETRTINGKIYYIHHVKKQQTLYSISRAYQVDMQEIIDRNPEIREGLKAGQTLYIPSYTTTIAEVPPPPDKPRPNVLDPEPVDPYETDSSYIPEPDTGMIPFYETGPCRPVTHPEKTTYHIALFMHFFLKDSGEISLTNPTPLQLASFKPFRYLQFYEGFLLAVDSLKKTGANFRIYVYDVEPTAPGMEKVLKKPEMKKMDLMIGMVYNTCFKVAASWAKKNHVPLVSPVSEREAQVENNPMVIKVQPNNETAVSELTSVIAAKYPYAHILVVRGVDAEAALTAEKLMAECRARTLDITEVTEEQLLNHLIPAGENIVVAVTTQKSVALNILGKLNSTELEYDFRLFGLPRWDQFEGLDLELMEKSRTHIVAPWYIDPFDPATRIFEEQFQMIYQAYPEILAYQGYDVGFYFLKALYRYGRNFPACLPEYTERPLLSRFNFSREPGDGWENIYWNVLRFENYSYEPVW